MTKDVYTLHKPIRNRIRQYDRDSLLKIAMLVLLRNEEKMFANTGYVPWECMLLIRWIFQYSSSGDYLKQADIQVVNRMINDIKEIQNKALSIDVTDEFGLVKFMRRTAFQQFTYQMPLAEMGWKAGRQLIMFDEMGKAYGVDEEFRRQTGLSIKEFIGITFSIFSILRPEGVYAVKAENLYKVFTPETVQKYFDLVAINIDQAKLYLDKDAQKKGKRFVLQFYELSPLVRKPFLIREDNYVVFSKRLFRQFFANFIYDFLYDLNKFNCFADILEKYVRQQLEEHFEITLDKSWKKILGKETSAPDFTICSDDATTMIEVKRKDLDVLPKVMQTNDSLAKHLDDSIVKGVTQIYSLANEIISLKPNCIKNYDNIYGVVVSYRDHYLRGGQQFWDEFLDEQVGEKLNELGISSNLVPPENIFLLSVDEYDYLMQFLRENEEHSFHSVFSKVKEYEADPSRSSFFFQDHLQKIAEGKMSRPNHLWGKIESVIDDITEQVRQSEQEKTSIEG